MPKLPSMQDPLDLLREMWSSMGFSIPGMVTPTLDADEIERRISDLRAVESWLKMNLNTLQMSIQGLEMQRTTLDAVRVMTTSGSSEKASDAGERFSTSSLWPWSFFERQDSAATEPATATAKARRRAPRAK